MGSRGRVGVAEGQKHGARRGGRRRHVLGRPGRGAGTRGGSGASPYAPRARPCPAGPSALAAVAPRAYTPVHTLRSIYSRGEKALQCILSPKDSRNKNQDPSRRPRGLRTWTLPRAPVTAAITTRCCYISAANCSIDRTPRVSMSVSSLVSGSMAAGFAPSLCQRTC